MQIQIFPFTDKTAKEAESLAKKLGYGESYAYTHINKLNYWADLANLYPKMGF